MLINLIKKVSVLAILVLTLTPLLTAPVEVEAARKRVVSRKVLNVAYSNQMYNLSCEIASLEMGLRYRGHNVNEQQLIDMLPKAQPYSKQGNGNSVTWGDPDLGFVGNIQAPLTRNVREWTGWGVNQTPVANIAKQYNQYAYGKSNGSLSDLRAEIDNGTPIVIWLQYDERLKAGEYTYQTPTGKNVRMFANHVVLVKGYETYSDGSTAYFINDPWDRGRTSATWKVKYAKITGTNLDRYWGRYNRDMVVTK